MYTLDYRPPVGYDTLTLPTVYEEQQRAVSEQQRGVTSSSTYNASTLPTPRRQAMMSPPQHKSRPISPAMGTRTLGNPRTPHSHRSLSQLAITRTPDRLAQSELCLLLPSTDHSADQRVPDVDWYGTSSSPHTMRTPLIARQRQHRTSDYNTSTLPARGSKKRESKSKSMLNLLPWKEKEKSSSSKSSSGNHSAKDSPDSTKTTKKRTSLKKVNSNACSGIIFMV